MAGPVGVGKSGQFLLLEMGFPARFWKTHYIFAHNGVYPGQEAWVGAWPWNCFVQPLVLPGIISYDSASSSGTRSPAARAPASAGVGDITAGFSREAGTVNPGFLPRRERPLLFRSGNRLPGTK